MELIVGLIGGLGIGSVITSIVAHYMTRQAAVNDRWYREKREAYLGLLDALHQAAVRPSDAHAKDYALWQTRCELFGSENVTRYAQAIVETNDGPREKREIAFHSLIKAMKQDLKN